MRLGTVQQALFGHGMVVFGRVVPKPAEVESAHGRPAGLGMGPVQHHSVPIHREGTHIVSTGRGGAQEAPGSGLCGPQTPRRVRAA